MSWLSAMTVVSDLMVTRVQFPIIYPKTEKERERERERERNERQPQVISERE